MRGAFVIRLGAETKPSEDHLEGWVEEVDSGRELRFRSAEELMNFLGQRFDLVTAAVGETRVSNKIEQVPSRKKNSRKERSSS